MSPAVQEKLIESGEWQVIKPIPEGALVPDLVLKDGRTGFVLGTVTGFSFLNKESGVATRYDYDLRVSRFFPDMHIAYLGDGTRIRAVQQI